MHTPSGRFQPSTRLCLSISDFHPKSFNPAWEVSTILVGLLSFMTSDEITTGSLSSTPHERKAMAARTRWWNSTGGGSNSRANPALKGNVKAGDGGAKFRAEWPDVDAKNWEWMREEGVDLATGRKAQAGAASCGPPIGLPSGSGHQTQAVVEAVVNRRDAGSSWAGRNRLLVFGGVIFLYVLVARLVGGGSS